MTCNTSLVAVCCSKASRVSVTSRALPASAYLSLATPRFLLRIPYGKRTDPIDAFAFEEFSRQSGLSGMLWGHPAILTANLLAETTQLAMDTLTFDHMVRLKQEWSPTNHGTARSE